MSHYVCTIVHPGGYIFDDGLASTPIQWLSAMTIPSNYHKNNYVCFNMWFVKVYRPSVTPSIGTASNPVSNKRKHLHKFGFNWYIQVKGRKARCRGCQKYIDFGLAPGSAKRIRSIHIDANPSCLTRALSNAELNLFKSKDSFYGNPEGINSLIDLATELN